MIVMGKNGNGGLSVERSIELMAPEKLTGINELDQSRRGYLGVGSGVISDSNNPLQDDPSMYDAGTSSAEIIAGLDTRTNLFTGGLDPILGLRNWNPVVDDDFPYSQYFGSSDGVLRCVSISSVGNYSAFTVSSNAGSTNIALAGTVCALFFSPSQITDGVIDIRLKGAGTAHAFDFALYDLDGTLLHEFGGNHNNRNSPGFTLNLSTYNKPAVYMVVRKADDHSTSGNQQEIEYSSNGGLMWTEWDHSYIYYHKDMQKQIYKPSLHVKKVWDMGDFKYLDADNSDTEITEQTLIDYIESVIKSGQYTEVL